MANQTTFDAEYWVIKAVGGVVAILFGLAALFWPALTVMTLVVLFGIYVLIEGLVELVAMARALSAHQIWWTHLVLGLIGVVTALAVFIWPGISTVVLLYFIAAWALVLGVMEILAAFTTGRFLLAIAGVVSILFGLILFINPAAGALALITVIGIFAIVRGIILIVGVIRVPLSATPS